MTAAASPLDRTRWSVVLLGFLAGVAGMFQTAKMSVVLVDVQRDIGLTLVEASWTTTAVSVTGALFGVVAGRVVAEFGAVRVLVLALVLSAASAVATAVAVAPGLFLALRVFEGLGYLLVCSASPAMMAAAAAPRDKGTALAIWGAFVPVSVAVMGVVGPPLALDQGWRALFLASAIPLALLGGIVAAVTRDDAPVGPGIGRRLVSIAAEAPAVHARLYRSLERLGLGVAFTAFAALQVGVIALLPTYLTEAVAIDTATAGLILSASAPFAVAGTVVAGVLVRLRAPDMASAVVAFVLMGATASLLFGGTASTALLVAAGVAFFTAGGVVGSVIFASLPRRSTPGIGVALLSGLIVQFGNVGSLTGAPILAGVAEGWGWTAVPAAIAAMTVVGIAGSIAAR